MKEINKKINFGYEVLVSFFDREFWLYYLVAIVGTYILVISGFDWQYFIFVKQNIPKYFLYVSDILGFLIPTFLIIFLLVNYKRKKSEQAWYLLKIYFITIFTAIVSAGFIKSFAGRVSPPLRGDITTWVDNSLQFKFGFMREQIIGGFPSSHATVAFALALVTWYLFPEKKYLNVFVSILAIFVAWGVTLGFHWFSELFAGFILGIIVAKVINKKVL